jgi:hypothetical protein
MEGRTGERSTLSRACGIPLPEEENERRFRQKIVPRLFAGKPTSQNPVAVFSGGQPGIGKTSARETMTAQIR